MVGDSLRWRPRVSLKWTILYGSIFHDIASKPIASATAEQVVVCTVTRPFRQSVRGVWLARLAQTVCTAPIGLKRSSYHIDYAHYNNMQR
jgi:hypothetical protein